MAEIDQTTCLMAKVIGLRSADVAEIGNFSERFARDLLAGKRPWPADVADAIVDICDDAATMAEMMLDAFGLVDDLGEVIEQDEVLLPIFFSNDAFRKSQYAMPARGFASSGFAGPFRYALYQVVELCRDHGIEVTIYDADKIS